MSELIFRSDAAVAGVDAPQRMIELVAVPWEQEADVAWRGEMYREVFTRGAFTGIEEHAGRVRVNREHNNADIVGKVVSFEDDVTGLLARVKIAATDRGNETLALADEDMISASVGYFVKSPSDVEVNRRTKLRRVKRAFLDHLAMVGSPAFDGARVLAVREGPDGLTAGEPLVDTPTLDDVVNDPVLTWARGRLTD